MDNGKRKPAEGSQCKHCLNYDSEYPGTCPAFFPKNIPDDIFDGTARHEHVVEGQSNKITFIPDSEYNIPTL